MEKRKAKVFISCGQRPNERETAGKVKALLNSKGYNPYLAEEVMSLDDIVKITKELNSSDYFLFIDFYREINENNKIPISLFSHQELAWARLVGFKDNVIIMKNDKTPLEGFLKYIQGNPRSFSDGNDLINNITPLLDRWDPKFSRNLVVSNLLISEPYFYNDHTGQCYQRIGEIKIENMRPDVAAVDAVCILDKIVDDSGISLNLHDRTYLKWSGQKGYRKTILPKDHGKISIIAIRSGERGLFLNSEQDIVPREPIIKEDGDYVLCYKIFAENFPLLEFKIQINFKWTAPKGSWDLYTKINFID